VRSTGADEQRRAGRLGLAIAGRLGAMLLRAIGATWRVSVEGVNPLMAPDAAPIARLGVFWHRNIIAACHFFRDADFGVSVSRSRDGDLVTALLQSMGYTPPARGSSSRGGSASLRALVREVRKGRTVSLVADGPRGPARRAKAGVVILGQLTGAPIYPVAFSASAAWRAGSWDGTIIPLPFARVVCAFGELIRVPPDDADEEAICAQIDAALNALTNDLDARLGYDDPNRPPDQLVPRI
jgi:lysophospholipid acyltransferase (LPLAT)-like uncharacterized protein